MGVAAANAEKRKVTRYGSEVLRLSIESHGRLGANSQAVLYAMARPASTYGTAKVHPSLLVQRWRGDLELALFFIQADIMLQARGALSTCAGPDSYPIGKLLPGSRGLGGASAETAERSSAALGAL